MYKRILLKISGEALSGQEAPIGFDKVNAAAAEIASLAQKGLELGIVVGGGNIIRGRDAGSRDRNRMDHMGMLATYGMSLLLHGYRRRSESLRDRSGCSVPGQKRGCGVQRRSQGG